MRLKLTLLLFCMFTGKAFWAQEIDTVALDVLVAPNSPGFTLLGINPTTIDKPSTPTDFAFSVANSTNAFSGLPKNYSIELLPIPLIFSKSNAAKSLFGKKFGNTLAQTFSISAAFTTSDTVNTSVRNYIATRTGIGFKVSILRGHVDETFEKYRTGLKNIRGQLANLHELNKAYYDKAKETDLVSILLREKITALAKESAAAANNPSLSTERKQVIADSLALVIQTLQKAQNVREEELKDEVRKKEEILASAKKLKEKIENLKFRRWGAMLDVAGGTVLGFRNNDFQNSVVQQYAFWINGGWAGKNGLDFLALARYNTNVGAKMNLDSTFSDLTSFDVGGKIEFTTAAKRFSIGAEGIARFVSDTNIFRYTFNTSYQVKKNQALTLSVGKDFGSTKANVGGSLIATLNYILAFGTQRVISLADLEEKEKQ